ncbi:MAG: hypothetical protein AB2417_01945 [Clostridiaceae bacterium]
METLQSGIMDILVQGILSILGVIITYFITVLVSYLSKKKEMLIKQIGAEQYNGTYNIAKSIFYAVEQQFKYMPQTGTEKKKIFDQLLLNQIPSLSQEELDHFREAIVGEINTQLKNSKLLEEAPIFNPKIDEADPKITE